MLKSRAIKSLSVLLCLIIALSAFVTASAQTVRITVPEYTFSPRLEEWHQLVILHYLALADGTASSDQVITFGGLKDGLIRGTKFDHDMEKELQRFLNGKTFNLYHKLTAGRQEAQVFGTWKRFDSF